MSSDSLHSGAPTKHLPRLPQHCAGHPNRGRQSPEEPEEVAVVWGLGPGAGKGR